MSHRHGAGCLPSTLVARGAAVPMLASPGSPLTTAATQAMMSGPGRLGLYPVSSQSGQLDWREPHLCWSRGGGWGEGQ